MELQKTIKEKYWKLANFIIEKKTDYKLGIQTSNDYSLRVDSDENKGFSATLYPSLEKLFSTIDLKPYDVFADCGCGKGRVALMAATLPIRKVIGIEVNPTLFTAARDNLMRLKNKRALVDLFYGDVLSFPIDDVTVFYLFNPFGPQILEKFIARIEESLIQNPRNIRVIYRNPVHRALLDQSPWLDFSGEIENTEIFVWSHTSPAFANSLLSQSAYKTTSTI